jgi:hypothetical protein
MSQLGVRFSLVLLIPLLACVPKQAVTVSDAQSSKRALIVAIGEYPDPGWVNLASSRDAVLIREALEAQSFDSIRTLQNHEATDQGILEALDDLAEETNPGDVVVVHYSGHGFHAADDNGDELDGVDELIVGYNASLPMSENLEGYIRDDELGERLDAIRRSAGTEGHVLFLFDSCFSGTITRSGSASPVRSSARAESGVTRTGRDASLAGFDSISSDEMASYVVLSAARYDQQAAEAVDPRFSDPAQRDPGRVGSLTLAFTQVLANMNEPMSYAAFYQKLRVYVSQLVPSGQLPQIEGDQDTQVLAGTLLSAEAGISIQSVDGDRIVISQGKIHGLTEDSQVEVHPHTSLRPSSSTLQAVGRVVDAGRFSSVVQLETSDELSPSESWAFVTSRSLGDRTLRVSVDPKLAPLELRDQLRLQIEQAPELKLVLEGGRIQVVSGSGDSVIFDDGECLANQNCSEHPPDRVLFQLKKRAYADYLRTFETRSDYLSVAIELRYPSEPERSWELCPVEGNSKAKSECSAEEPALSVVQVADGQEFAIRVTNTGPIGFHYSVVAITSDHKVFQVWPDPKKSHEQLARSSSRDHDKGFFSNGVPFTLRASDPGMGREMVRVFAVPTTLGEGPPTFRYQAQFTQIDVPEAVTRGASSACTGSVMECPFGQSMTRGALGKRASMQRYDPGAATASLVIEVVEQE